MSVRTSYLCVGGDVDEDLGGASSEGMGIQMVGIRTTRPPLSLPMGIRVVFRNRLHHPRHASDAQKQGEVNEVVLLFNVHYWRPPRRHGIRRAVARIY